jgi:hypothetical protein
MNEIMNELFQDDSLNLALSTQYSVLITQYSSLSTHHFITVFYLAGAKMEGVS